MSFLVRGTVLQTPGHDRLEVLEDVLIAVGDSGTIRSVSAAAQDDLADYTLPPGHVLIPGLIDTHVHAPQWPQLGTGYDLPLEQWLFAYTFPLEARYQDLAFATSVWDDLVPALLRRGTTTAVYYGSIHGPATTALAEACLRHGQRAFVGRVAMDHPEGTPEFYRDIDAATAVADSHRSVEAIRGLPDNSGLVRPIITPRFIPACSNAALEGLGELAAATGTPVQTHCSESDWEHGYVLDRFGRTDADQLHRFGLVGDHSVLAHATHLTDDDRRLLRSAGAGVAHCPLSNAYFSNAMFPARRAIESGLRVGLGTDIAGGPEPAVLAQCHHAVTASRLLEDGVDVGAPSGERGVADSRIDITTAFWLATVGGADLLGLPVGLLEVGRSFDAVVIDRARVVPSVEAEPDNWELVFERLVRNTGPEAIRSVWVSGNQVVDHDRDDDH
ncbi:MAG: amidohydrolase family protein [Actinomycetota bacterium]